MFGASNKFKKAVANKRARPKVTFDYDDEENSSASKATNESSVETPQSADDSNSGSYKESGPGSGPAIASTKPSSRLKKDFGTDDSDDDSSPSIVKSVSRKQVKRSGGLAASMLNSKLQSKLQPKLPTLPTQAPSSANMYSKSYIDELRHSTMTTPAEYVTNTPTDSETKDVDMIDDDQLYIDDTDADVIMTDINEIPDEALINHLIEKRHQKAAQAEQPREESDFISLDDDDNSALNAALKEERDLNGDYGDNDDYKGRLQKDDGLAENQDDFIAENSDGRIPLTAAEAMQQKIRRRREMAELINDREDEEKIVADDYLVADDSGSDSGWEEAQLQKGAFGSKAFSNFMATTEKSAKSDRAPRSSSMVLQELPDLPSVIKRLKLALEAMSKQKQADIQLLEELQNQTEEISAREKQVTEALEGAPF
ncbi:nineteen complex-related protein 2-domain-containing protein [Lipomyces arxii]|uniref:nineteen complex-related protein 2-domain-containing protein n=1 Tax=Lipomyces arxii TaxID=56418 RepID=UPI0034CFB58A